MWRVSEKLITEPSTRKETENSSVVPRCKVKRIFIKEKKISWVVKGFKSELCKAFSICFVSKLSTSSRALKAGTRQISRSTSLIPTDAPSATTQTAMWSRRLGTKVMWCNVAHFSSFLSTTCLSLDRVLDQLHDTTLSSSPQAVPTSAKSPSQEFSSSGSNNSCSNRWKRSSPDPNKMMMMGRSPIAADVNAKRVLSTTPQRRVSNHVERVGSPCLSGLPVRWSFDNPPLPLAHFWTFLGRSPWVVGWTFVARQQWLLPTRPQRHLRVQNGPSVLHPHRRLSEQQPGPLRHHVGSAAQLAVSQPSGGSLRGRVRLQRRSFRSAQPLRQFQLHPQPQFKHFAEQRRQW